MYKYSIVILEVVFKCFINCFFSRKLLCGSSRAIKTRGSMGRVPALRAESIFYWIRQEKRKRRDAIAKLEYKTMYFYTEAQKRMHNESNSHIVYQEDGVLPPLPIRDIKCDEVLKEFHSEPQVGTETIHVMNERKENNEDENNFNSQVKSLM